MIKAFNQLCSAISANLHDALPIIVIIIFYQMTILEIPLAEIVSMLGWIVFVSFGLIMIL